MAAAEQYLAPIKEAGVDTLVLGCTHYPLLSGAISYVMGDEVTLVNSADETAKDVYRTLVANNLLRTNPAPPTLRFQATGDAKPFGRLARRFLGPEVTAVEHLPEAASGLSATAYPITETITIKTIATDEELL